MMREEKQDPCSSDEGEHLVLTDDEADDDEQDDSVTGGGGGSDQHTLKLASTIAVKSEVFCLAFSEDGRCFAMYVQVQLV